MKIALITTTINVPKVLELYRKLDGGVKFYVAADEKTPREAYEFCADIPDCEIYTPDRQRELGYECSELLGWNCVQRRNVVLLEALKEGAEVIVTIDDDNAPMDVNYFHKIRGLWEAPVYADRWYKHDTDTLGAPYFNGLQVGEGWFDPGQYAFPNDGVDPVSQRGFPQHRFVWQPEVIGPAVGVKVGVASGIILGNPDTSAIDRISRHPTIHQVSELLRAGIVVAPKTFTIFNTQNTAFLRDFAPAMFCSPHMGRYDDIYASLLTQRVMWQRGYQVHIGQPFVWQARNAHDLMKDLALEQWGAENIIEFSRYLADSPINGKNVIDDCDHLMLNCPIFSDELKEVAAAWYRDCEKVL